MNIDCKIYILVCLFNLIFLCGGFPQYEGGDNGNNNNNGPDFSDEDLLAAEEGFFEELDTTTLSSAQVLQQVTQTFGLVGGILNAVFCNQWFGVRLCPSLFETTRPPSLASNATAAGISGTTIRPQNVTQGVERFV